MDIQYVYLGETMRGERGFFNANTGRLTQWLPEGESLRCEADPVYARKLAEGFNLVLEERPS